MNPNQELANAIYKWAAIAHGGESHAFKQVLMSAIPGSIHGGFYTPHGRELVEGAKREYERSMGRRPTALHRHNYKVSLSDRDRGMHGRIVVSIANNAMFMRADEATALAENVLSAVKQLSEETTTNCCCKCSCRGK